MKRILHYSYYVLEAFIFLSLSIIALKLIPFKYLSKLFGKLTNVSVPACSDVSELTKEQVKLVGDTAAAINFVSKYAKNIFVCLPQCLATSMIFRLKKIPFKVIFGVNNVHKDKLAELSAHSWIIANNKVIIGKRLHENFKPIAAYCYNKKEDKG